MERIDWSANVEAFLHEMPGLAYDDRRRWVQHGQPIETLAVRAKVRRFLESSRAIMPEGHRPFYTSMWSMYEMMSALKDLLWRRHICPF